jgi:mannan endo-1,6-alpha-mannosidase
MTRVFFKNDIMVEMACEPHGTCNVDQRSFKASLPRPLRLHLLTKKQAFFSRSLAMTVKMAPFTAEWIMPKLRASAIAAAKFCSWGEDKNTCGMRWTEKEWEKWWGVGEQLSALETIQSTMILGSKDYVTERKGGISKGDPGAGSDNKGSFAADKKERIIGKKDKGGAAALTVVSVLGVTLFAWWVSF